MHRLFHCLSKPARRREVVVVIFGGHSEDWMKALAASAPVWKQIPEVRVVLNVIPPKKKTVPLKVRWGRRVVILPLMEAHIAGRPRRYDSLAPSQEALEILADKERFAAYVEQQGLGHLCPETYESIETAVFPCVIKRTRLNGGRGVELAASIEEARQIVKGGLFAGHPHVVQARVPFLVEYVIFCVCVRGRIIWHTVYSFAAEEQHLRKAGYPHFTFGRLTIPASVLKDAESFLLPLDYSGPCNIDCTWDAEGRLTVFEINPRLGGSLMRPDNVGDLAACLTVIINQLGADRREAGENFSARVVLRGTSAGTAAT